MRSIQHTPLQPRDLLSRHGEIFATFDHRTQDSGNISYGLRTRSGDLFVKTAGLRDDHRPLLGFTDRVRLLRSAASLHRGCPHPALATLLTVIASPEGPLLVYKWAPGRLLRGPQLEAVRQQPAVALSVLARLYGLHDALAAQGWIAVDLYLGSLLYDAGSDRLTVIDLDHYRRAPFTNQMGRMFGSSTLMAPEEFRKGERIDQQTTVFTLGRLARVLAPALESAAVDRATAVERAARFETVSAFVAAFRAERSV